MEQKGCAEQFFLKEKILFRFCRGHSQRQVLVHRDLETPFVPQEPLHFPDIILNWNANITQKFQIRFHRHLNRDSDCGAFRSSAVDGEAVQGVLHSQKQSSRCFCTRREICYACGVTEHKSSKRSSTDDLSFTKECQRKGSISKICKFTMLGCSASMLHVMRQSILMQRRLSGVWASHPKPSTTREQRSGSLFHYLFLNMGARQVKEGQRQRYECFCA